MTDKRVVMKIPPHIYRKFLHKARELGLSYNEAIAEAIETWLESFGKKEERNPVQPIVIFLGWPMTQPAQAPPYVVPAYSMPIQTPQLQPQLRSQQQEQEQEEFLVVSKDALIEPEIPGERTKLPSPEDVKEILSDIEANPWTDILRRKGEEVS